MCPACWLALGLKDATTVDSPDSLGERSIPALPMPERVGDWRVVDKLGEGGMGVVYRVEEEGPMKRQGALKRIKHGLDSQRVLDRFDQERRVLSRMDHPGIARAFDAGRTRRGAG